MAKENESTQDEQAQANEGKQANQSKQSDNSSQKRAGQNEKQQSKGDKETQQDSSSESEDKKSLGEHAMDAYVTDKATSEGVKQGAGAIKSGFLQGLKGSMATVGQSAQAALEVVKAAPAAMAQTVALVVTSVFVSVIAAVVGAISAVVPVLDSDPIIKYVPIHKAAIGNYGTFDLDASKREVARCIWSTMSCLNKVDNPDGVKWQAPDGSEGGIVKVFYGLRSDQILAMLGNFEHESGLDPTAVETIMNDPFNIGGTKQYIMMNDFVVDNWKGINQTTFDYFTSHSTIHRAGAGLAQWTDTLSAGANWDITNPGRNCKLMTYAKLIGMDYYLDTSHSGWNGEDWVKGDTTTENLWYDLRVQLAYMTDKADVGDTKASWIYDWGCASYDEIWSGDEPVDMTAFPVTSLQGWDSSDAWSTSTGWDKTKFKISLDQVTISNTEAAAIGEYTHDTATFRGTNDLVPELDGTTPTKDEYYNTTNASYRAYVKYETWESVHSSGKDGSTNLNYPCTSTRQPLTTAENSDDSARATANEFARKTAYSMWHGDINDGSTQPLDLAWTADSTLSGHDFLMENDPRTWDMSPYQTYLTAQQAATNRESTLHNCQHNGHSGTNCYPASGSHAAGCTASGCVAGCTYVAASNCPCAGGCTHTATCYSAGYIKNGDPCQTANAKAMEQFENAFKYYYRYHLYRCMTLYYTREFQIDYEGCADGSFDSRGKNAIKWYNMYWQAGEYHYDRKAEPNVNAQYAPTPTTANGYSFDDYFFRVNEGYGDGILLAKERTVDTLTTSEKRTKLYNYDTLMANTQAHKLYLSNKRIAVASAMIAWPTIALSRGNDGIPCYKTIHDAVMPGDTIYQSCDRGACTAIRWSGVDDNFPGGNTLVQVEYLLSSPRWVQIDFGGDQNQLMPGDVLIASTLLSPGSGYTNPLVAGTPANNLDHHIVIYIGNYIAKSYYDCWGTESSSVGLTMGNNVVISHSSFGERSVGMGTWYSSLSRFTAFRCIDPQAPDTSKYTSYTYSP